MKKKYFDDYKITNIPNKNGHGTHAKYEYIGELYTWNVSDSRKKHLKSCYLLGELFTIFCFSLTASLSSEANTSRFVAIPALLSLCCWIFEIIAVFHFSFIKWPLKNDDYKRINSTFSLTFPLRFLLLCIAAFAAILTGSGSVTAIVFAGYGLCSLIAFWLYFSYHHLSKLLKISNS